MSESESSSIRDVKSSSELELETSEKFSTLRFRFKLVSLSTRSVSRLSPLVITKHECGKLSALPKLWKEIGRGFYQ